MVELSRERIEKILHEESAKKEELNVILRAVYIRYMRLYERYFADVDALNDDVIAELRSYHEETRSLIKVYYMDIPLDVCMGIEEFENKYTARLLGPEWHEYLSGSYEGFKAKLRNGNKTEERCKAEFTKQILAAFYDAMDYLFREEFGTGSDTAQKMISGIASLLYGQEQ